MGYENGLVVFIDVLGTRNTTNFEKKLTIHDLWHDSAREVESRGSNFPDARTLTRKVFSFSDCAYYTYTFNERASEERKKSMAPFNEVLQSLTTVIQKILNEGFFVRGGAALGDVYVDDKGLFGPAAEKAYELESRHAIYPRIILENNFGERLLEYINEEYVKGAQPTIYKEANDYFLNTFYGFTAETNCGLEWDVFYKNLLKTAHDTLINLEQENIDEKEKRKIEEKMSWISAEATKENDRLIGYIKVFHERVEEQISRLLSQHSR